MCFATTSHSALIYAKYTKGASCDQLECNIGNNGCLFFFLQNVYNVKAINITSK